MYINQGTELILDGRDVLLPGGWNILSSMKIPTGVFYQLEKAQRLR